MTEMVERVAHVAAAELSNSATAISRDYRLARAILAAMREPTEAMLAEAHEWRPMYDDPPTPPKDYWQAMIDAALGAQP